MQVTRQKTVDQITYKSDSALDWQLTNLLLLLTTDAILAGGGKPMPAIKLEYDDRIMSQSQAETACKALQEAVASAGFENVFVYGNTSEIKINIAPIKAWIEVSAYKVTDRDKRMARTH